MATQISLLDLPDELIHNIFVHLPAPSAATFGQTSQRLHKISNTQSLWRKHCREIWSHWEDSGNDHSEKSWKHVFFEKAAKDKKILAIFEDLLSTQQSRLARIQEIAETYQYDAKDALLRQIYSPDDAEDVLARRYWSTTVLNLIHRQKALQIWDDMQYQDYPRLEESLGAFDLFVQGRHNAPPSRLNSLLDDIAQSIKDNHSDWDDMDYIAQAVAVSSHLRQYGLVGSSDSEFHRLRNNFMCLTLTSPGDTTSLPLQSVSIFCCVAQRLGVNAWPCNFPRKIFAVVEPPEGPSLQEMRSRDMLPPGVVWMDPFSNDDYFTEQTMRARIRLVRGLEQQSHQNYYLTRAFTRSLVARTGINIITSVNLSQHQNSPLTVPDIDSDLALYSSLWSMLMMTVASPQNEPTVHQPEELISSLFDFFPTRFPEDTTLVERFVMPIFYGSPAQAQLTQMLEEIRFSDGNAKPIVPRDERTASVKYKVGQVFQHARYRYVGVIIGWDPSCQAGEDWIQTMRVTDLPRGRDQSFYHIVGADKSSRYVAEENITVMEGRPPESLMRLAGRYFKRWDEENDIFVSNIQDEYPDD